MGGCGASRNFLESSCGMLGMFQEYSWNVPTQELPRTRKKVFGERISPTDTI